MDSQFRVPDFKSWTDNWNRMCKKKLLTKAWSHTWESDIELVHQQYWPLSVFLSVANSLPIIIKIKFVAS